MDRTGRCEVCFTLLDSNGCSFCNERSVFFDRHISLYPLVDRYRPLLIKWKFDNQRGLYRIFRRDVLQIFKEIGELPDRVMYIDSGKGLYDTRNYQPCGDICKDVGGLIAQSYGPCLRKESGRSKQSSKEYQDRFLSIHNSFKAITDLDNENIMLIEDVFTTGATANEAARILKLYSKAKYVSLVSMFFRDHA